MNHRNMRYRFFGIFIVAAVLAVFSAAAMLLWNALVPNLFGLPALNYWQTAGLLLLTRIFVGSFGKGILHDHAAAHAQDLRARAFARNPLREKWMNMTDAERKEFIAKEKDFFRSCFSRFHHFFDEGSPDENKDENQGENKGENRSEPSAGPK